MVIVVSDTQAPANVSIAQQKTEGRLNMTFSEIIRQAILDDWQDKAFTYHVFLSIAKKHNKKAGAITAVLNDLWKADKLLIIGEQCRPNGGSPSKVYKMAEGAELITQKIKFSHAEWLKQQREKEQFMHQCANRLDAALNKMTVLRMQG